MVLMVVVAMRVMRWWWKYDGVGDEVLVVI